jgi:hypothetical protein
MTRNRFFAMFIVAVVLLARPVAAAPLTGTVYSQGSPVANLTITVKDTGTTTTTNARGQYHLDLSAGAHTLVVRGQEVKVNVPANGATQDIQL